MTPECDTLPIKKTRKGLRLLFSVLAGLFCMLAVTVCAVLLLLIQHSRKTPEAVPDVNIISSLDSHLDKSLRQAELSARSVTKKFWISEDADKGPVPNPDCYGRSDDPSELDWLLDEAEQILNGQETLFSTDTVIMPGSEVIYYLDESIFAVTWKQIMSNYVYTISEIKVSDPSQFRRHLSGGVFGSSRLNFTTVMAKEVNAVVGTSADHYKGRKFGIVVYDGEVKQMYKPQSAHVCYIDQNGDLLFTYGGDLTDQESAQKFVDEHEISFSISFGPVLIDNGIRCEPKQYPIGEINGKYARAALCQMDSLHYLVVAANKESIYYGGQTIKTFAENLEKLGCRMAYTMDGGNTAAIAVDGKLVNRTAFGYQRQLSDIIYFATAVPDHTQ